MTGHNACPGVVQTPDARYNRLVSEPAIEVRGLRKAYGPVEAVRGVDFSIRAGEIFCLIGPNGAGKTTTVEILEGHRTADTGEVRVLGHDPARGERAFKERIGIVLQRVGIQRFLTVEETLEMFRGYYPHPLPVDELLTRVGLTEQRKTLVRRLSGGQMRRLDTGVAMAGDPDLLFLDEPTTGFDPAARRSTWEMLKQLKALGKTVLLTTHYMEEAEYLADRVAIIALGRIVKEGNVDELRRGFADSLIRFRLPEGAALPEAAAPAGAKIEDGIATIATDEPTRYLYELTAWATQKGVELDELSVRKIGLEEIYLELTTLGRAEPGAGRAEKNGEPEEGRP